VRGAALNEDLRGAVVLLRVWSRCLIDKGRVGRQHHGTLFRLLPVVEGNEAPSLRRREEGEKGGKEGGKEGGRDKGGREDDRCSHPLVLFRQVASEGRLVILLPPSFPPSPLPLDTDLLQGLHVLRSLPGLHVPVRVGITVQPTHASNKERREWGGGVRKER